MKKPIDMLIAIKKPWLEQVTAFVTAKGTSSWHPEQQSLAKFWDLMSEAYLRQEPDAVKPILERWLHTYFVAEMDTGKLSSDVQPLLIPLLSLCELTCLQVSAGLFDTDDRLHFQDVIVPLFNRFYDLAAKLELGMYLHEVRRREKAVRDEVQRLDETRSSFINTAAHELKTPLTLIEGYAEMLADTLEGKGEDPDFQILMRGINTGTTKMRGIIDELIDISLVDNQMLSLYYQPVDIEEILEKIASDLDALIQEKSIELKMKAIDEAATKTYADGERLQQAFAHVIRNAIQYTPEDGLVELQGRTLPGFIEISCRDTGIGIAREEQATIFEKFGRMPSSLARRDVGEREQTAGTGLGLHLAKGILEAHGGTIWVESPGRDDETCPGSTFHMMLPLRDKPPDEVAIQRFGAVRSERHG